MILQNTRILVIDDVYDEVKKLLLILNKNGLSFNYYRGDDLRELPNQPLRGVRLLFLDFVLGTEGQSDNNKISALMNVIKKTIPINNGPYIILAWTKHDIPQDNLLDLFKQKIMESVDIPTPTAIINLDKRECMNSLPGIGKKIKQEINDKQILEILLEWEAHAKTASREVVGALSDISKPQVTGEESYDQYSSDWNSRLERHIYWIAESALGKNIKPDKDLLMAAQFSFTELFRDYVETVIRNETKPFKHLTQKICSHRDNKYSPDEQAYMNSSFLLIRKGMPRRLQPGNMYKFTDVFERIKCERKDCYYNKTRLTKNEIVKEFFKGDLKTYPQKKMLIRQVVPILIEITPECDYTQKKWRNAKMILGVMWPKSLGENSAASEKLKLSDFLYRPVPIEYNDKIYCMTFNAHHLFNVSFKLFSAVQPILKARKEFLVDIQHWFSKHMSRPGKTEF